MNRKEYSLLIEGWRKFLFETEGDETHAREDEVEVVFPDRIFHEEEGPGKDLLLKGDQDGEISGFVRPKDVSVERAGIYYEGRLVGFMTPREEQGGWRVGAIYVDSDERKRVKGIGSIAIAKFFEGRAAADLLIGVDNIASQRAFGKAGFSNTGKAYKDDSDGWEATWWSRR
jgi:hypothetical protein